MLSDEFEFVKGFPKTSASKTDFWKLRRRSDGKYFALKIFVHSLDNGYKTFDYSLLKHEIRTYKFLKKKLIDMDNVRNILMVYGIGVITFEDIIYFILKSPYTSLSKRNIVNNLMYNTKFMIREKSSRIQFDKPSDIETFLSNASEYSYAYMLTPFLDGPTFGQFITGRYVGKWNIKKFCNYVSVVMVTLYQMMRVGINQNDLHMSNILLSNKLYGPTEFHSKVYLLIFSDTTFIVNNEYTSLIYDFDRAALYGKYVSELEKFEHGGNCPLFHNKRDFIRVLCGLYQFLPLVQDDDPNLRMLRNVIVNKFLLSNKLKNSVKRSNKSCWMETRGSTSTQCDNSLLDTGMIDVDVIVKFFLRQTNFKTLPTVALLETTKAKQISEHLYITNKWKVTTVNTAETIRKYIFANIQFVGNFSRSKKITIFENLVGGFTLE